MLRKQLPLLVTKMVANWANRLIFPFILFPPPPLGEYWPGRISQGTTPALHKLWVEFPRSLGFPTRQKEKGHNHLNNSPKCKGASTFCPGSQYRLLPHPANERLAPTYWSPINSRLPTERRPQARPEIQASNPWGAETNHPPKVNEAIMFLVKDESSQGHWVHYNI